MAAEAEQHVEPETAENTETTPKRKFEPSILDNFTKLTNAQEKVRIKSGVELLKHLTFENSGDEKATSELKYALGRLIRGLGASKIQTRTGYFAALVALLNLENVSVDELLEYVAKELHKGGGNSKSENADVCSGQILVAGAAIRSNVYETSTNEDKTKVLELLIKAGKERTYLNLAAYTFIVDLYTKIDCKEFQTVVFPIIKNEAFKPWTEQNLDTLFLLTETLKHFPEAINSKFMVNSLGTEEILSEETIPQLCCTLMTIPRITALKHPIYDIFIKKLQDSDLTVQFFTQLDLTLHRSNRNKYFVFTKLLTGTLENLPTPSQIPDLLTKHYIQQTLNTFKTAVGRFRDKDFQQSAQKLFETIVDNLKKAEVKYKTKIKVLKKLLFYPGTFIFEKVTKSKLVQNITATLNKDGVKKLADIYREVIMADKDRQTSDNSSEKWWNNDRVYASHLLVKLVNHPLLVDENDWKVEQLKFLMKLGLLRDQSDNIGQELADQLKETFFSSLDLKLSKLDDLRAILSKIFHELDEIVNESNLETVLREPLDLDDYATFKRTVELVTKLDGTTKKKKAVFHTLFLHLGLQLFNNVKLAAESLKELFSCYERVKKGGKTSENADDPMWIEVVVDLFLNLLSHNSHLLRSVIGCVFPHLCVYMNGNAIHQILSVLDPKNEDNPLSKGAESSDDDDEDDDGDDDDNSEKEEDESDDEEEEDDDDDEEDEITSNDKLRLALQQALGVDVASDAESIDLDDLNDEDGEKLDEALGQAFKQFKPNLGRKKKQNKDDQTLTHFRIRVLDLIEMYLNGNPSMILTLEIMLPLLQILEFSIRDDYQKPLQDRVRANLKKLSMLKKFGDYEGVTEEILVELLRSLLEKGTKNSIIIHDMGEKIAECCGFIISCSEIVKVSKATPKKKKKRVGVNDVIRESMEVFFNKRDCLTPYILFKKIIQLNWVGIVDLVPVLFALIFTDSSRPFRRYQALELLKFFFTNHRFLNSHQTEVAVLHEATENFLLECVAFFNRFSSNPKEGKIREKFFCNLFEVLSSIKNAKVAEDFKGWATIASGILESRSHVTFSNDTKTAFRKLCKGLKVSHVVAMKPTTVKLNADGDADDDEKNENEGVKKSEKRKKKFNKENRKLKKESKELRMQSLSEGFGGKRKVCLENGDSKRLKMDDFL